MRFLCIGLVVISLGCGAKMAEIHWSFCNAGELPKGADKVLPREFRTYETK